MREIKFRAWILKEDSIGRVDREKITEMHMSKPFFITEISGYAGDYSLSNASIGDCDGDLLNDDSTVIMQYIGRKDKNGTESYEGDIVVCSNNHKGVVEWEDHDCCFNVSGYYNPSNDYPTMAFMEDKPFEVIGNIYENPELLK